MEIWQKLPKNKGFVENFAKKGTPAKFYELKYWLFGRFWNAYEIIFRNKNETFDIVSPKAVWLIAFFNIEKEEWMG